jgi:hypothetical protein
MREARNTMNMAARPGKRKRARAKPAIAPKNTQIAVDVTAWTRLLKVQVRMGNSKTFR